MGSDEARREAAYAMRDLIHAFARHDPDDEFLRALAGRINEETARLAPQPVRDRMALMTAARARAGTGAFMGGSGSGFDDRAVGGHTNPTGIEISGGSFDEAKNEVTVPIVLRRAFEGAPGRAHGGIVAAAFDDITGFVIGIIGQPAFTGELTIRYEAPVPVDAPLVVTARFDGQERRKIYISGECTADGNVVARCKAIYIAVDPAKFAGAPDPR
jgi:acyl-coenzyme A thioesterase PaaI-like protein